MDKAHEWTVDYGNPSIFGKVLWGSENNKHIIRATNDGAFDALMHYAKEYGNARVRCPELNVDMKCVVR